jgi:hypothetical protein
MMKVPKKESKGDVRFDPRAAMGSSTRSIARKTTKLLEEAISFTKREMARERERSEREV